MIFSITPYTIYRPIRLYDEYVHLFECQTALTYIDMLFISMTPYSIYPIRLYHEYVHRAFEPIRAAKLY